VTQHGHLRLIQYFLQLNRHSLNAPFILSGVRNPYEVDYLKKIFQQAKLIFLDTPLDLCFTRRCLAGVSKHTSKTEFEDLISQERQWGMELIQEKADVVIQNIGNLQKFFRDLDQVYGKLI
jgi:hypothetical protein